MTLLVTAASGQLGRLVVDSLLARGARPSDLVASSRDVARLADLAERGIRTVRLDYDEPETVAAALAGVDRVLLVSSSEPGRRVAQHATVIDAAAAAGVERIVYTSAPFADSSELILAPEHKATEELIAASGLPATILRNNWYTENYLGQIEVARATGALMSSAGDGRVASASRRDFAEAAAVALLDDGHLGQVYELAGDTAWPFSELAETISQVIGSPVEFRSVSTEEHAAALAAAGLDAGTVGFVTALEANIAAGTLAFTDGTLARLIGRPTTPLLDGLRAAAGLPAD